MCCMGGIFSCGAHLLGRRVGGVAEHQSWKSKIYAAITEADMSTRHIQKLSRMVSHGPDPAVLSDPRDEWSRTTQSKPKSPICHSMWVLSVKYIIYHHTKKSQHLNSSNLLSSSHTSLLSFPSNDVQPETQS